MPLFGMVAIHIARQEVNMQGLIHWVTERLTEPSTYAAISVGAVGMGAITTNVHWVWAGLVVAAIAVILHEKA